MTRDQIIAHASALPHASREQPFGPEVEVWKIGGRIFAALGGDPVGVTVKCADIDTARLLIDLGRAEKARYFHASWVRVRLDSAQPGELAARLTGSYDQVRAALPRRLRLTLEASAPQETATEGQ